MSAYNTIITLTQTSTGEEFDLGSANIVRVVTNTDGGSNVYYDDGGAEVALVIVDETASTIATNSEMIIAVTDINNVTSYINPNRIRSFQEYFTPLTGSDITDDVEAHAGGGQGSATALTTEFNVITVCATAGDSVKLPAAAAGLRVVVYNTGAATAAVFPATGDTINSGAANASVNLLVGNQAIYTAEDATNWVATAPIQTAIEFDQLGAAPVIIYCQESVGVLETEISDITTAVTLASMTYTNTTGITAFAGGGQGSATALTTEYNNVTTVATAGDSVKLPTAAAGVRVIVKNNGAAALAVFPNTSDTIDGGSANASITLPPLDQVIFSAIDATDWETDRNTESLTSSILFTKEANHTISVDTSTTAAAAGGNLTATAGTGATSGVGGTLALNGGAGGATGAGGPVTITTGASTNATSGTAAASGALTATVGTPGTATTGTGGAGGAIALTGKAGGAATGAAGIGGAGSAITATSGAGGASSNSSGGNAGAGGALTATAGAGGAATGTGAAAGGAGGAAGLIAGAGGAAAGTSASGAGGAVSITAGAAGAKTGTGAAAGGVGGAITATAGAGGATASSGSDAGGAGGDVAITAGGGGAASAGTGNGGAGGSITITPGTGGSSAGGTAGVDGMIIERGVKLVKQGAPTAKTVSATLTTAEVLAGIITVNQGAGATSAQQLPLASAMDTAFPDAAAGDAFDFSVINISTVDAEDASLTTNTGWTLVGSMDIHAYSAAGSLNSSGRFRARKTGSGAWTLYRLS